jgi:tetratricopeptide (TPR) repeat protein
MLFGMQNEFAKAIADYDEAIRLDPKNSEAFQSRAWCRVMSGEVAGAFADFGKASLLNAAAKTPVPQVYFMRGVLLLEKGQPGRAAIEFDQVIKLEPKTVAAYALRAEALIAMKKYDRAGADLDEVLHLKPGDEVGLVAKAMFLAACPDAKFRDGKKALELAKKVEGNAEAMAAAYAELGDFTHAVHWQEQALKAPHRRQDIDAQRRLQLYKDKKAYRYD